MAKAPLFRTLAVLEDNPEGFTSVARPFLKKHLS